MMSKAEKRARRHRDTVNHLEPEPTYPWAPLVPLIRARLEPVVIYHADSVAMSWDSAERISDLFHISERAVWRWQANGMNWWQADRIAIRLGYMPYQIWPEWLDNGLHPLDRLWPLEEWWRPAWLWAQQLEPSDAELYEIESELVAA